MVDLVALVGCGCVDWSLVRLGLGSLGGLVDLDLVGITYTVVL